MEKICDDDAAVVTKKLQEMTNWVSLTKNNKEIKQQQQSMSDHWL